MKRTLILYGSVLLMAIVLVRLFEYYFLEQRIDAAIYWGTSGALVLIMGVWIGKEFFSEKKKATTSGDLQFDNADQLQLLGLSGRELEVLQLIEQGLSNQKIADRLFLSLSTVKTHTSNIYSKLGVKNRVQALQKARELISRHGT